MRKIVLFLTTIFFGMALVFANSASTILGIITISDRSEFLSGVVAGRIDKAVFNAIPKVRWLNGLASGLIYAALHDAGSLVWAGCGDWLYSVEELREDRHDRENIVSRLKIFESLVKDVTARNVLFVAVPVPDKAEQVEDQLCGIKADRSRWRDDFWAGAAKAQYQINLRDNWPRPGFWRTDTHWDRQGARFAADKVAQLVIQKIGAGSNSIRLTKGDTRERLGDLARLAGLEEAPRWLAPDRDVEMIDTAEIARPGGLLDETQSPSILLAGSSFSLNSGFLDYLEVDLSREVVQASQAGGGFAGSLLEILEKNPHTLANVSVVIWEFPMRSLSAPLSEAERRFIAQSRPE